MQAIVRDTSPAALADANEANLIEAFKLDSRLGLGEFNDIPELFWFTTGVPLRFWNGVARTYLEQTTVDEQIQAMQDRFRSYALPATWFINPTYRTADLGERLLKHRFLYQGELPAMGIDLRALPPLMPFPLGVRIERVRDQASVAVWVRTMMGGEGTLQGKEHVVDALQAFFARVDLQGDAPLRLYLAWQDDEPVATAVMFLGAGVAGIYAVETVEHARRQGIGTLVTLVPLLEAHSLGYHAGVLQATEQGYPIYQRLGFTEHFRYHLFGFPPAT